MACLDISAELGLQASYFYIDRLNEACTSYISSSSAPEIASFARADLDYISEDVYQTVLCSRVQSIGKKVKHAEVNNNQ